MKTPMEVGEEAVTRKMMEVMTEEATRLSAGVMTEVRLKELT